MSTDTAPPAAGPTAEDEEAAHGVGSPVPAAWRALPRLLRAEPALASLIGAADVTVAVPEAAQAVATAALATLSDRGPIVVVTPTGLDADRLGDDLACLLDEEEHGSRSRRSPARTRRRPAGLGDVAVRARQPRDRDDGSAAGPSACADGRARRSPARCRRVSS